MKNIISKLKNITLDFKLILIILIVLINFFLLFKPEIFRNKASYITVKAKKQQLESINSNVLSNTNKNTNLTMEVADLKEQDVELEKRAMVNRKEIDPNGLEFHLPSILIRLEDSSKANGLSIAIKYSEIAYQDIQGKEININSNEDIIEDEGGQNEPEDDESNLDDLNDNAFKNQDNEGKIEDNEELEEPENETDKIDSKEIDSKDIESEMIEENKARFKEEGVEVTTIPIEVKGSYSGVKKFIKDLDKLNYLEPTKVEITSLGQTVESKITISIFHGDIFR